MHCFIYIYWTDRTVEVIIFVVSSIFGTILVNRVVSEFVLISLKLCFQSVHHHIQGCIYNILFPLYNLFSFRIPIVWSHTLHCSRNSETITWNTVVCELFCIQLMQYFFVHTIILNFCTHNIIFTLFLCIYFTDRTVEVVILIVWSILEQYWEPEW